MKWELTGSDRLVGKASWAFIFGGVVCRIGGSSWMNSMLSEEVTGTPRKYGYTKLLSFYMLSLRIGFILNVLLWRVSNIFDIPGLEYSLIHSNGSPSLPVKNPHVSSLKLLQNTASSLQWGLSRESSVGTIYA